jgi:hypothetical protein
MKPRYRRLLFALAAIGSVYLVKLTGLDQGLIDEALNALVDAVSSTPEVPE